jgi:hypothetical protein
MMNRRTRADVKQDAVSELELLLSQAEAGDRAKAHEALGFFSCMIKTDLFKNPKGVEEQAAYKRRLSAIDTSSTVG